MAVVYVCMYFLSMLMLFANDTNDNNDDTFSKRRITTRYTIYADEVLCGGVRCFFLTRDKLKMSVDRRVVCVGVRVFKKTIPGYL